MVIKNYSVSLEEEIVESAKKQTYGGKLSPILNELLKEWLIKKDKEGEILKKYAEEK